MAFAHLHPGLSRGHARHRNKKAGILEKGSIDRSLLNKDVTGCDARRLFDTLSEDCVDTNNLGINGQIASNSLFLFFDCTRACTCASTQGGEATCKGCPPQSRRNIRPVSGPNEWHQCKPITAVVPAISCCIFQGSRRSVLAVGRRGNTRILKWCSHTYILPHMYNALGQALQD